MGSEPERSSQNLPKARLERFRFSWQQEDRKSRSSEARGREFRFLANLNRFGIAAPVNSSRPVLASTDMAPSRRNRKRSNPRALASGLPGSSCMNRTTGKPLSAWSRSQHDRKAGRSDQIQGSLRVATLPCYVSCAWASGRRGGCVDEIDNGAIPANRAVVDRLALPTPRRRMLNQQQARVKTGPPGIG